MRRPAGRAPHHGTRSPPGPGPRREDENAVGEQCPSCPTSKECDAISAAMQRASGRAASGRIPTSCGMRIPSDWRAHFPDVSSSPHGGAANGSCARRRLTAHRPPRVRQGCADGSDVRRRVGEPDGRRHVVACASSPATRRADLDGPRTTLAVQRDEARAGDLASARTRSGSARASDDAASPRCALPSLPNSAGPRHRRRPYDLVLPSLPALNGAGTLAGWQPGKIGSRASADRIAAYETNLLSVNRSRTRGRRGCGFSRPHFPLA
jgi:hypothetical protein